MKNSISDYMKIPYVFNGRGWKGTDCYGFMVLWFLEELGIQLFDAQNQFLDCKEARENDIFKKKVLDDWISIKREDVKLHDGLLIKTTDNDPFHCGIVLNYKEFIQLQREPGVNVGKIDKYVEKKLIYGFYRYKGL